ncbi:MAG TPA: hypothetical protein VK422_03005 [Pyrinomonadaceae bacterium]|nr:hypothetical protein [Pyrinomonadaceae bacterium]
MQKPATRIARAALALLIVSAACVGVAAQDEGAGQQRPRPRNDTNHEVQLHLLVTSSDRQEGAGVPRSLDGVVRQLRASLPPSEYRLAATFINRVKDGGGLEVRSVGSAPFTQGAATPLTPTFFQFSLGEVRHEEDAAGQGFVNIRNFRLGLKIPIQTAPAVGGAATGAPVIQYEDTGINTQLSVREGEPTLVGTLGTRVPNQLFVLVITVKRAGR